MRQGAGSYAGEGGPHGHMAEVGLVPLQAEQPMHASAAQLHEGASR